MGVIFAVGGLGGAYANSYVLFLLTKRANLNTSYCCEGAGGRPTSAGKTQNKENIPMDNSAKSDFPQKFPIGPDPLSEDKLKRILEEELREWKIVSSPLPDNPFDTRIELYRDYRFEDFDKVIEFMTKVAIGCNIFPHHPRWENT